MTKVKALLAGLPDETKQQFIPLFGDVDKFYTVMYLIAKNEHITGNEKPDRYQERLDVIRRIRSKVENIVTSFGLDGSELVADVAATILKTMLILGSLPLCLLTKSLSEQLIK